MDPETMEDIKEKQSTMLGFPSPQGALETPAVRAQLLKGDLSGVAAGSESKSSSVVAGRGGKGGKKRR